MSSGSGIGFIPGLLGGCTYSRLLQKVAEAMEKIAQLSVLSCRIYQEISNKRGKTYLLSARDRNFHHKHPL